MNKIINFILSRIVKMDFLDGYRSYFAGAGFVAFGIGLIANQVATPETCCDEATMEKGIASILAGVAILGRAGKTEKLTEAMKNGGSNVG